MNYYNEHDPKAAHWLRSLIAAGLIPDGYVDERSICDVKPSDLDGYLQVHLFAGIGGWPYALSLAGWPADAPVWTGSCPCQPFGAAGKRRGVTDERHLWPEMHRLVQERKPPAIFGEQVSGADGLKWFGGVRADLEDSGYAVGCADLPAASVGAPHKRQRLFWVADAGSEKRQGAVRTGEYVQRSVEDCRCSSVGDTSSQGLEVRGGVGRVQRGAGCAQPWEATELSGVAGGMEYTESDGRQQGRAKPNGRGVASGCGQRFWRDAIWLPCGDGKTRRIEPGIEPLVTRLSGRVAFLRGLGNAIVPQVGALFVRCFMESVACEVREGER